MTKRERVEFLLEHRQDFYDPAGTMATVGSPDSGYGVPLLPMMAHHPSVLELERAINRVRMVSPAGVKHALAWYGAEWRIVWRVKKTPHGKTVVNRDGTPLREPHRARIIPPSLVYVPRCPNACACRGQLPQTVCRTLDQVTEAFRGDVFIPDDLLELVAA